MKSMFGILISLAVAVADTVSSYSQCPNGYVTKDNRICYKLYTTTVNRTNAAAQCAKDGGYLASVPSKFNNDFIYSMMNRTSRFTWLGITCNGNVSNCKNDDGTPFGPYNNFDSVCLGGYSFWRGSCYSLMISSANETAAEERCAANNGHLASIHSDDENSFVFSLLKAQQLSYALYRIGLQYTGVTNKYNWTDGTTTNYTEKIENLNTFIGDCFAMSLSDRRSKPGNWGSVNCDIPMPYVCKAGKVYDDKMILAPLMCNSSTDLTGNGTVYSPGYPLPYGRSDCEYYVFSQKRGEQVVISFPLLYLADGSTISIYNDESLYDLVIVLNSNTTSFNPLTSKYGSFTIMFEYGNDVAQTGTGWKMTYGPASTSSGNN